MMFLAFGAVLVVGWLLGGSVRNFGQLPVRGLWLAYAALAVDVAGVLASRLGTIPMASRLTYPASYALLAGLFLLNWRLPGTPVLAAGAAANAAVVLANGGAMPVQVSALLRAGVPQSVITGLQRGAAARHVVMTAATRLNVLGDWLWTPRGFPHPVAFSVGDALLVAGMGWLVLHTMLRHRRVQMASDAAD